MKWGWRGVRRVKWGGIEGDKDGEMVVEGGGGGKECEIRVEWGQGE